MPVMFTGQLSFLFFCFYGRLELPDQIKMEHDDMHLSILNEMEKTFPVFGRAGWCMKLNIS
jgi:hypothetical protein